MIPLILTADVHEAIRSVVAFADAHRYTHEDIARIQTLDLQPPGDVPELVVEIPMGFRCVYSVDQAAQPYIQWYRHLGVSLPAAPPDRAPSIPAVALLIQAFGFKNEINKCSIWLEDLPSGRKAVNIIEPLEPA